MILIRIRKYIWYGFLGFRCFISPLDSFGECVMFLICSIVPFVGSFTCLVRYCYHDISWRLEQFKKYWHGIFAIPYWWPG